VLFVLGALSLFRGMSINLVDLLDRDRFFPVYEGLCSSLDVVSIVQLRKVCKRLRSFGKELWDVDRLIGRFMGDSKGFREEMRKHDAVVSGGLALQFFARATWKESDMDVFVRKGPGVDAFHKYLTETEGYKFSGISRRYLHLYVKVSMDFYVCDAEYFL